MEVDQAWWIHAHPIKWVKLVLLLLIQNNALLCTLALHSYNDELKCGIGSLSRFLHCKSFTARPSTVIFALRYLTRPGHCKYLVHNLKPSHANTWGVEASLKTNPKQHLLKFYCITFRWFMHSQNSLFKMACQRITVDSHHSLIKNLVSRNKIGAVPVT